MSTNNAANQKAPFSLSDKGQKTIIFLQHSDNAALDCYRNSLHLAICKLIGGCLVDNVKLDKTVIAELASLSFELGNLRHED